MTGILAGAAAISGAQRSIITAINTGASSLSFVGSAFIVLCYCIYKDINKYTFKLVFYLALSDMLCSFFLIVGDPSKAYLSFAQGYTTHFFCVASFLWTTTIAFTLHRTILKHKSQANDLEAMFHLYVWGTSLVVTVIRSFGEEHTCIAPWCWSDSAILAKAVHFLTFYAPLWGAILYNGFTYFDLLEMIEQGNNMGLATTQNAQDAQRNGELKVLNRWGYYPLILIGSWAFGTINRIHEYLNPAHKIFWLSVLDVGTAALMGLFNSIAYAFRTSLNNGLGNRELLYIPDNIYRWARTAISMASKQFQTKKPSDSTSATTTAKRNGITQDRGPAMI
uniref:G-protein coupled receptor n=1 Tax=Pisum sativum TaxID=3888 RepID=Q4ZH52_PEA|nr:G-protein coupled receptor [Pisum sativum]